jgi:hypothetical protein
MIMMMMMMIIIMMIIIIIIIIILMIIMIIIIITMIMIINIIIIMIIMILKIIIMMTIIVVVVAVIAIIRSGSGSGPRSHREVSLPCLRLQSSQAPPPWHSLAPLLALTAPDRSVRALFRRDQRRRRPTPRELALLTPTPVLSTRATQGPRVVRAPRRRRRRRAARTACTQSPRAPTRARRKMLRRGARLPGRASASPPMHSPACPSRALTAPSHTPAKAPPPATQNWTHLARPGACACACAAAAAAARPCAPASAPRWQLPNPPADPSTSLRRRPTASLEIRRAGKQEVYIQ